MYNLLNATKEDIPLLKEYKKKTIFEYAKGISDKEQEQILTYVDKKVPELLNYYKVILVNNIVVGCLLTLNYEDGIMLDEIYLINEYRNKGIGSSIISDLEAKYSHIYLWVYKDNIKAKKLYNHFGFEVIDETKTRYFMRFSK